ncbi:hypothetical protein TNCV_3791941 [Trichonephila clavipes]|nr:hypothetical protein TNCV_3791941 [Trichonephila clavipes]
MEYRLSEYSPTERKVDDREGQCNVWYNAVVAPSTHRKATKSRQTRMMQHRKPSDPHDSPLKSLDPRDATLKPSDLHDAAFKSSVTHYATATTHTLNITVLFACLSTDLLVEESVAAWCLYKPVTVSGLK